ncbi:DUF6069 family protein [Haloferacaceae archaeon DSL9]
MTAQAVERPVRPAPRFDFVRTAVVAAGLAILAALAVRIAGGAVVDIEPGFTPLAWQPIVLSAGLSAIGATAVYALLARYTERPERNFLAVASAVFLLSFGPMGTLVGDPAVTTGAFALLALLHVAVAAGVVAGVVWMTRLTPTRSR